MAHLYQRARSPFWWLSYNDPETGRRRQISTGYRVDRSAETRSAKRLWAEYRLKEFSAPRGNQTSAAFRAWVPTFLAQRYASSQRSLTRYRCAWRVLELYLSDRQIFHPRQLTRADCLAYAAWRSIPDPDNGRFTAGHNSTVLESKTLSLIMDEAVRRGYCATNPAYKLGLHRITQRQKPELDDADFTALESAIADAPERWREFFAHSFAIARYSGCRLVETHLNPLTDVDLDAGTITFRSKGGKWHTAPLHPKLAPIFAALRTSGRTETYLMPKSPSRMWHALFRRAGVSISKPGACFHSLRVTAVSRLARSDVSEAQAMAVIGHASTTVHRTYQRFRMTDLRHAMTALG